MRVVVTGGTGLIGRGIMEVFCQEHPDWEVTAVSRKPFADGAKFSWKQLDIADYDAAYATITKLNPDVVIHTAAMALPDDCAKDPQGAWRSNFLGTRNVALACSRFDAELVYFSTDQAFYGAPEKVHEEYDEPKGNSVYSHLKILGETYVREHLNRWWIVRTGKVFGASGDTHSFLSTAYHKLANGEKLKVATDFRAHQTHAFYLARALTQLIQKKTYGIYHLASPGVPTYREAAEFLVQEMQIPKNLLIPVSRKELGLAVERAAYLELSLNLWRLDFGKDLPSWKEGIRLLVQERKGAYPRLLG